MWRGGERGKKVKDRLKVKIVSEGDTKNGENESKKEGGGIKVDGE